MKLLKKTFAVLLSVLMLSSTFTCFAAELNNEAVNEHYGQYKNYLLLGDSVASGYRDEMSDNDKAFNKANNETTYWRVPGSYADVLANAIVENGSMTAFAGPGFRTIEIRYMLEDDFAATCDDEYLFHPAQLYVYEDYGYEPGDERIRQAYKDAVKEADLITLGVGGNDWGAYLGWVIADIMEKENVADKYVAMLKETLSKNDMGLGIIEQLVDVAHTAGVIPELLSAVPSELYYGLSSFYKNWDIMIQDIYDLNPDVTLMVMGMSDNSLKGSYFDYNGVEGEKIETEEQDPITAQATAKIIEFIMSVGNKPMIDGAEKFGYTYVDTTGATYVDSHPDADGHVFMANKIIEALPDADIFNKFEDATPTHKYYKAIEYVVKNGYMNGTDETTFSPDENLTKAQLSEILNVITGDYEITDSADKVSKISFAFSMLSNVPKSGIVSWVKSLALTIKLAFSGFGSLTRGEAAKYIMQYTTL